MDLQQSIRIALLHIQDPPVTPRYPTQHSSLHQQGWCQQLHQDGCNPVLPPDRLSPSMACGTVARDPVPLWPSPEQLLLIPLQAPCQEVAVPVAAPLIPAIIFRASVP